tara:strand:+ start:26893 stop:27078 length:186 start_codon:yes stop_codon:yes gene_type:complete
MNWKDKIIELDDLRKLKKISQTKIANELGLKQQQVNSFFRCLNCPSLDFYLRVKYYLEEGE